MNQKFTKNIHKALCKYYRQNYGNTNHQLSTWKINFTDCVNIPELKKIHDKYVRKISDEKIVTDAFKELTSKGYLIRVDRGYYLTEEGFFRGTRGILSIILAFLKKKSVAAIIISFLILLVTIAALYVNYVKP